MSVTRQNSDDFLEPSEVSAVRSHQSLDPNVYAICHHSGRYLTRQETIPLRLPFREQHDFPGFPELDQEFAKAIHSPNHQHLVWNRAGLQGLAMIMPGIIILLSVIGMFIRLETQVSRDPLERTIFYITILLGIVIGSRLSFKGGWLLSERTKIYHQQAKVEEQEPRVKDFPLECTYNIKAHENLEVTLGNDAAVTEVIEQNCLLTIELRPQDSEKLKKTFQKFCELYQRHDAGSYIHAGTLALENVNAIQICKSNEPDCLVEYDHRVVLRKKTPKELQTQTYSVEDGPLATFKIDYMIDDLAIYGFDQEDKRRRFPLECVPKLKAYNSRTLELHFYWKGDQNLRCILEECILDFNTAGKLAEVDHVERGRYDKDNQKIIWRKLAFKGNSIILRVSFEKPILEFKGVFRGKYRCQINGLLSGLIIQKKRLWNALGLPASREYRPMIKRSSVIEGDLSVTTKRLMQEHEYVCDKGFSCPWSPKEELVRSVLSVLAKNKVDIQRIEQARPRLDLAGSLETQLRYWDIVGRKYQDDMLDVFDVHLVIAGYDFTNPQEELNNNGSQAEIKSQKLDNSTHIDIRIRCLHDPRDKDVPTRADEEIEKLATQLKEKLVDDQSNFDG